MKARITMTDGDPKTARVACADTGAVLEGVASVNVALSPHGAVADVRIVKFDLDVTCEPDFVVEGK